MDAVDCQGFAGGFTLGTVQAGFRLVAKREHPGGFGLPACENNRHLLGNDWDAQCSTGPEWEARQVPYVFGNPPCSGFSLMSSKEFRGINSKINSCMWDLFEFAARCNPQVVVMESVQQAYKKGLPLMRGLVARLEELTGDTWWTTHVLQDARSLGGCAVRPRYFLVAHRIPFGVERKEDLRLPLPTLRDAIGDLEPLATRWDAQEYRMLPSEWARPLMSETQRVDGMAVFDCMGNRRSIEMLEMELEWNQREPIETPMHRHIQTTGDCPPMWAGYPSREKMIRMSQNEELSMGFNQPYRWPYDEKCRVITGASLSTAIHPTQPRPFTHREALRVMGFPDDWRIAELQKQSGLHAYWGKGVTVGVGRWVSEWVRRSLEGNPGTLPGEVTGERETVVSVHSHWRELERAAKARG